MDEAKKKQRHEELKRLRLLKERKQKQIEKMKAGEAEEKKSALDLAKEKIEQTKEKDAEDPEEIKRKNQIKEEMKKKQFEESLHVIKQNETFIGSKPEKYDEQTQCEEIKEEDSEKSEDEEENLNRKQKKKNYDQLLIKKKRLNVEQQATKIVFYDFNRIEVNNPNEKEKKEMIDKNKETLLDFVHKEKNFIEKALSERRIISIFGKEEDEEDKKKNKENDDKDKDEEDNEKNKNLSKLIKPLCEFYDDSCYKRVVTSLEMSTNYREILLAGYSKGDEFDFNQQSGLIHLWSFALRKFPEFTFQCQSEITSAILNPFNPNIVIGGTSSGQVFLWDIRGKSLPFSKSPFGAYGDSKPDNFGDEIKTHSSRIECLAVIGTINASNIISVSDGILCKWSQNKLDKPVKIISLKRKQKSNTGDNKSDKIEKTEITEMGVLSIGYQQSENNSILIGSDDNNVYQVSLIGNEASEVDKTVISSIESTPFVGHTAPVLSIDMHPMDVHRKCNFGNLFLTSSTDWTTRVFSKNQKKPLITIDANEDYIYCSKWCPMKASVFACGDGSGHLDFWDLNYSLEDPKIRYLTGENVINKLCWSEDARRLMYGNNNGRVKVLSIGKGLYRSKLEDSLKFEEILNQNKI